MPELKPRGSSPARFRLNEDWLAVFIAFLIILFAALGWFGPQGLPISF